MTTMDHETLRRQAELDRDTALLAAIHHMLEVLKGLTDAVGLVHARVTALEHERPAAPLPLPPNAVVEEPLACEHTLVNFVRQAEVKHAKTGWQRLRMGAIVQAPPQPDPERAVAP